MSLEDIPVLSGGNVLGHIQEFRDDRLGLLDRVGRECPDIGLMRLFTRPVVFVGSPAYLQEVLVDKAKSFQKSPGLRTAFYPLAGEGLLTSGGDLWKRQRKIMAPIFQPAQLGHFAHCMAHCAGRGAALWQDGATIDVGRDMTRIAMSIAGKTLFDTETFDQADDLGDLLTTALEWSNEEVGSAVLMFQTQVRAALERASDGVPAFLKGIVADFASTLKEPILWPTRRTGEMKSAIRKLDERVQRMIDERRAAGLTRNDLLTKLLAARDEDDGSTMTDRQVRDEILTLFIAGHETTATALTWSFHLLSQHPEAYGRVREEADALGGRPPGAADLPRLQYTLKVFKEALRIYPPLYLLGRQAVEDVEIGPYSLPAGTVVFFSAYALHRRPDVWPEPDRFDPDRFAPEAERARPRQSYLPFGAGPRVCIGNHFALMEGPIVLARLTQHATLDIERGEAVEPAPFATLRPKHPLSAVVRARSR